MQPKSNTSSSSSATAASVAINQQDKTSSSISISSNSSNVIPNEINVETKTIQLKSLMSKNSTTTTTSSNNIDFNKSLTNKTALIANGNTNMKSNQFATATANLQSQKRFNQSLNSSGKK